MAAMAASLLPPSMRTRASARLGGGAGARAAAAAAVAGAAPATAAIATTMAVTLSRRACSRCPSVKSGHGCIVQAFPIERLHRARAPRT